MKQEAVSAQLARILASPQFAHSERLSRFLKLAVAVAQRGEPLKEYRIGVDVFDRGKDFDPRTDPIVRVQAAKLRSKLLEYYAGDGGGDPLVISVPKGSYAAEIRAAGRAPLAAAAQRSAPPVGTEPAKTDSASTRVAVLPFVSMSTDPENEHFADGLTEELINRLTQVQALQVVARTSAFRFKNRRQDLREVGALLNVGSIVEGSVRRAGDQIRVTAQLIDVASGYHKFSRTYQRQFSDVLALQDELAQAVVDEFTRHGDPGSRVRRSSPPSDLAAYLVYQRAMLALNTTFGDYRKAEQLFRDALAIDSRFAPAWSGLAHTYWLLTWYRHAPSAETWPLCKQAAQTAIALDPHAAEAHCALGLVASGFEWNWPQAEACFERAIELQPSLAITYPFYAIGCLLPQGKTEQALATIERSLAFDPLNPLFLAIAAFIYLGARRYGEVHRLHALGTDLNPAAPPTGPVDAVALELEGRHDEAIAVYRKFGELGLELTSFLGHALAQIGRVDEARACVAKLIASDPGKPVEIARVYSGLRDADESLRWLEVAVKERAAHLLIVPADPRFDWLRSQPRYAQVMRSMNLPAK
jgi:TolB-like protein/tetratricopeptide (TPR) repeat protein